MNLRPQLLAFMKERHCVTLRKAAGKPKPWTKDPILQTYRFCNVCRELDAVTQWIATNWREPNKDDPHLWFQLVIARLLNQPGSLAHLGYLRHTGWSATYFVNALHAYRDEGHKVFNAAYIVSTNGRKGDKVGYLAKHVLSPLWAGRAQFNLGMPCWQSLAAFHTRLCTFNGLGSFMAAQVVADLKYVAPLAGAPDWWSWAASGPGSRRGLNRVLCRPVDAPWKEREWLGEVQKLRAFANARSVLPLLHTQDMQNCLCEFDKYQRVKLGEGRPKQLYKGVV